MFNKYPEGARFLGYFKKDECVGTAGWLVRNKRIELIGDIVAEDHRGQGIYRKLFQMREALCWKMQPTYLYSYATRMSLPTYLKNGFKEVKRYNYTSYVRKDK
jgi:GNAT superfamily N-acetyltransferase